MPGMFVGIWMIFAEAHNMSGTAPDAGAVAEASE